MNYILAIITLILFAVLSYLISSMIGCNFDILYIQIILGYLFIKKFAEE